MKVYEKAEQAIKERETLAIMTRNFDPPKSENIFIILDITCAFPGDRAV
jgi:hypothetical protein